MSSRPTWTTVCAAASKTNKQTNMLINVLCFRLPPLGSANRNESDNVLWNFINFMEERLFLKKKGVQLFWKVIAILNKEYSRANLMKKR